MLYVLYIQREWAREIHSITGLPHVLLQLLNVIEFKQFPIDSSNKSVTFNYYYEADSNLRWRLFPPLTSFIQSSQLAGQINKQTRKRS